MLEKLIWIAAFMLVGARHPGATIGVVEKDYRSEVSAFPKPFFIAAFFHTLLYYITLHLWYLLIICDTKMWFIYPRNGLE